MTREHRLRRLEAFRPLLSSSERRQRQAWRQFWASRPDLAARAAAFPGPVAATVQLPGGVDYLADVSDAWAAYREPTGD
jgi:hypothetical protein